MSGSGGLDLHDDLQAWSGVLGGVVRPVAEHTVVASFTIAPTGCQPFLALCSDGKKYWVKHRDNPHGAFSLVTERVVAAVGQLIGAPVRPVALVHVPQELAESSPLSTLGITVLTAHGSEHLDHCLEKEELANTSDDGNADRQPKLVALWELFLGEDPQWLYDNDRENQCWSFDHGWWITGGEWDSWDATDLARILDVSAEPLAAPLRKMSARAFLEVADALESLTVHQLIAALATVPVAWDIPDEPLEALGWWLYRRRRRVAARMRVLSKDAKR